MELWQKLRNWWIRKKKETKYKSDLEYNYMRLLMRIEEHDVMVIDMRDHKEACDATSEDLKEVAYITDYVNTSLYYCPRCQRFVEEVI
ncbi:hypothetical protein DRH29_02710 [candidate division Kazan bacterium]|uniref:Uncharacterized protein n=1 Tax=candidate division Kazan bacterium TaxID=2202143 RepID=A0A420ZCL5_UNCK3|nr:MAG: hypothetical protein DRH29_02710 [candidate division Kazan bacterium]